MATHTWTVFPASGSANFETTARTALETWRSNSSIMDGVLYDHKARHIKGGADEIDGDIIDVDFTPSNYTPATVDLIASDVNHLAAHLQGIDSALSISSYTHPTGDGNLHVPENSTTNEGKVLTASAIAGTYTWKSIIITPDERTSNTILIATDTAKAIDITSGTFTQTFAAVATLGDGWFIFLRNSGTGDITLDPNGSEEIDGKTAYIMYPGEARLIVCDGTKLTSMVLNGFYRAFSASGTFHKPPGYNQFRRRLYGAGGGGGGGQGVNAAAVRQGGGGGGGGACVEKISDASVFGDSETVTIGAGGTGGSGGTSGNGSNGLAGGNTTIGTIDTSYGGGGGEGCIGLTESVGGGGGGTIGAGTTGGVYSAAGGQPRILPSSVAAENVSETAFGGAYGFSYNGGNAVYGGGGGAGLRTSVQVYNGGSSVFGGAGGGSGAQLSAAHAEAIGGVGGNAGAFAAGDGGAAGAVDGGAGGNGTSRQGGGGGGSNTDGTGGVGGAGGMAGGGGGGGAGNLVGGAGGAGGDGYAEIWGIV